MGALHNSWALAGQDPKGWVPSAEMCPALCGQGNSLPETVHRLVLTVSTSEYRSRSQINTEYPSVKGNSIGGTMDFR